MKYIITSPYCNSNAKISWSCAIAIAATLSTTVAAIWVTGGAALIAWLIAKGIDTAGIIASCIES